MKALLFVFSLFCLFFPVQAQDSPTRTAAESSRLEVDKWDRDVNLSARQKDSLEILAQEFSLCRDRIQQIDTVTFASRQEMKHAAYAAYTSLVEALLSPSQMKKLESKRAERLRAAQSKQSKEK